jgi:hypothetical protein
LTKVAGSRLVQWGSCAGILRTSAGVVGMPVGRLDET